MLSERSVFLWEDVKVAGAARLLTTGEVFEYLVL